MARPFKVLIVSAIVLQAGFGSAQSQVNPRDYQQNGSFLSRRFLTDSKNAAALTNDFLARADKLYKTPLLFPNGGLLSSTGVLDHAPYAAKLFLDEVSAYETANRTTFTIMPYLNGYSPADHSHAANLRLDLNDPAVRANVVAECTRYVSNKVPGSYVAGAARSFDGVVIDVEPAGDPAFFLPSRHSLPILALLSIARVSGTRRSVLPLPNTLPARPSRTGDGTHPITIT